MMIDALFTLSSSTRTMRHQVTFTGVRFNTGKKRRWFLQHVTGWGSSLPKGGVNAKLLKTQWDDFMVENSIEIG